MTDRVWQLSTAEKGAVLLRCSCPIGPGGHLKHGYLNQVGKKAREETDSTPPSALQGCVETALSNFKVWFAFTEALGRERGK